MFKYFNWPCDPGFLYDALSIQQVKLTKGVIDQSLYDFHDKIVMDQVGIGGHRIILDSPEYQACVKANTTTFEGVDDAWEDKVKASYVCHRNDDRIVAQRALMRRFFPDWPIIQKKKFTKAT